MSQVVKADHRQLGPSYNLLERLHNATARRRRAVPRRDNKVVMLPVPARLFPHEFLRFTPGLEDGKSIFGNRQEPVTFLRLGWSKIWRCPIFGMRSLDM